MKVLGISALYHDSAAAIVADGEILSAVQEERFTRIKQDSGLPLNSIKFVLEENGLSLADIDAVAFYDKPWLKFERLIETYFSYAPRGFASFTKMAPLWIKKKLWLEDLLKQDLDFECPLLYPEHHQSHAASAFFPSPFDESAILTLDGVGEWATTTWGVGKDNKIELKGQIRFPHSLGLLYSAFTYFCGFKVNSGEYKLMGLAPYGEPRYADIIKDKLIKIFPDGSFWLNQKYFSYCHGLRMTNKSFGSLFDGPRRTPESQITQREMDLAASVQKVTEDVVLALAKHVRKESGLPRLVLAGGVALNCVANGKLIREGVFDDVWIQPASGDAGGALGAAYMGYHHYFDKPRAKLSARDRQKGSFLGPKVSGNNLKSFLSERQLPHHGYGDSVFEETAKLLDSGKVVGWFQSAMEFGPRALGGRSIIADARNTRMQKTLNLKIKFRESFRPFAPVVLEERAAEFFEINCESPYMLVVAPVSDCKRNDTQVEDKLFGIEQLNQIRSDIPAVTHVDYSARVQTIDKERNPLMHKLLKAFEGLTDCPVLVNTSFNVRGEPMVCSLEDAYLCFMRTEMDVLVVNDIVLLKTEQPKFEETDEEWRTKFALD